MEPTTLREQNKSNKLRRIREAARDLFASQGFEDTSTRQIAARANVGLATLFLYASDKRDLLFLAWNDDLELLTERAAQAVDREQPILEQLRAFFSEFYEFYDRDRRVSRALLRELTFYTTGQQSARFQVTRQTTILRIAELIASARSRGVVASSSTNSEIAVVIFYVFAAEVRRWLGDEKSSAKIGLDRFEALIRVIQSGLD